MKRPIRQSKVIYKKELPSKTKTFMPRRLLSLHLMAGLFFIIMLIVTVFPPSQTSSQNAEPKSSDAQPTLHSLTILPTETPITPPIMPLEVIENLTPTPTPEASISAEAAQDFCIDVPVVMYHHIQPLSIASLLGHQQLTVDNVMFDEQMKYLNDNHYNAISADELITALKNKQTVPEKSIVITIDDGYDDNYTYAFLTAKKYEMIMNFMIPTKLIGTSGYMNWDHLREMNQSMYARIYNHTATHAPFGYILKGQIHTELATSTEDFKRELGLETKIFAYPYGSYNVLAIEVLKEHGFDAAFTTDPGKTHCLSNSMQLQRLRIGNAPMNTYGF